MPYHGVAAGTQIIVPPWQSGKSVFITLEQLGAAEGQLGW